MRRGWLSMRREREVNKGKEKVDAIIMQTRKRDGKVDAMERKPLPIQHFTYPTQPWHFYPIQTWVRTGPLHPPNPEPKSKPLLAKAKPPPKVKKGAIILTKMVMTREEDKKPRKVRMSLMGVSTDGDNNDNDREHVEKKRGRGARGP